MNGGWPDEREVTKVLLDLLFTINHEKMKKVIIVSIHASKSLKIHSPRSFQPQRNVTETSHTCWSSPGDADCANPGALGCSSSTASGSPPARWTLRDHGIYCWDDTPVSPSASLKPQQNCNSGGQPRNETVNLLTQSCSEDEWNLPDPPEELHRNTWKVSIWWKMDCIPSKDNLCFKKQIECLFQVT